MRFKNEFKSLRIVDNFYQTSAFYPMPVVVIGTLTESGQTNLGPYSLCFPYYIAGKDYYSMLLLSRNSSHTSQNLLRDGKCTINFISHKKKYMKECVRIGFPGDATEEKMKDCFFTLIDGEQQKLNPEIPHPKIIKEAFQVFECTWDSSLEDAGKFKPQLEYTPPFNQFNGITSVFGAHFILKIDRILMKEKFHFAIINGVKKNSFPSVPVDYGFRDNTRFWMSPFKKPFHENLPANKGVDVNAVWYAGNRIDPNVQFTLEACEKLTKVPRPFLGMVLKGCVEWAIQNGVTLVQPEHMDLIRDKRAKEKE